MGRGARLLWLARLGLRGIRRIAKVRNGGQETRFDYVNEYSQPGGFLGRMAGRVLVAGSAEREATRSLERLKAFLER